MNIPDEGFFTLLTQRMRNRTVETLQRALYHTLRDAILQGTLTARCRLPGSRVMAERLHLSRNTVNAALEQLALEGYLTRSRQGTQVAPLASCRQEVGQMPPVVLPERLQRLPAAMRRDSPTLAFTPGMPAVNYFPLPLWRRLMDNVLREDGSALLGYGEAAGDPLLREAIARHLALSRGIRCDIRQIVITEGALEGVNLCASLLTNPGDSVWLEEPGYLGARSGFQRAGLRVRGMAVDDEGMCIANGVAEPPRLIFTSPSHQYPCGSIMSAGRRLALVEYARRHGAWIVEDDYDSEFRHSGEPIPAMLGMVPVMPRWSISAPSAKRCFRRCVSVLWLCRPRWRMLLRTPLARCCAGDTVLNSGRWPALSRRDTMRAIWQRCAACTVNVSNSCARRWRKR